MWRTTTAIWTVLCAACGSDSPAAPDGPPDVFVPDASAQGTTADAAGATSSTTGFVPVTTGFNDTTTGTTGFVPVTTGFGATTTGVTGGASSTTGATGAGGMTTTGSVAATPDAGAPDTGGGTVSATTGPSNPDDEFDEVRQVCVDTINMYRATLDLAPIGRAAHDVELCSDEGAKKDGDANAPHSSAFSCPGRGAQNTCPNAGVGGFSGSATLADALKRCLAAMWAEGEPPEGREKCQQDYRNGDRECFLTYGHYLNMSDPSAGDVSCGFYDMGGGTKFWMNQDFGR